MKFRVDRDQFADAVAWAGRTVPARPATPMLSGLRLEVTDGAQSRLSIASYDYEVSGRVEVDADVVDAGVSLVNGRLLVDIARSLPGGNGPFKGAPLTWWRSAVGIGSARPLRAASRVGISRFFLRKNMILLTYRLRDLTYI